MSIARTLVNEFRPFFRLFDEVSRSHPTYAVLNRHFDRHLDEFAESRHPFIDLSEHGNEYIVEAEVPGVKKDNLEVRVGDSGRCLTIRGRLAARFPTVTTTASEAKGPNGDSSDVVQSSADSTPTPIASERDFVGGSHFTRTIWLPRPVEASKITAQLAEGILTLRVPKAEEQGTVKVEIQ